METYKVAGLPGRYPVSTAFEVARTVADSEGRSVQVVAVDASGNERQVGWVPSPKQGA